jgi:hypothetical protein
MSFTESRNGAERGKDNSLASLNLGGQLSSDILAKEVDCHVVLKEPPDKSEASCQRLNYSNSLKTCSADRTSQNSPFKLAR